tara:strand:- start:42 stop:554 length:513 start_codon:yes stop_codon:yes gene_type:complete
MTYSIKTIIDGKFWIVEADGRKCGTLRQINNEKYEINYKNGVVTVTDKVQLQEDFGIDIENGSQESNISQPIIEVTRNTDEKHVADVHGFPSASKPFNVVYDVRKKLPLYSKNEKSQSMHCAGYYVVKYENGWTRSFCPKLVTLDKYQWVGPYKSKEDMLTVLRKKSKEE